MAYGSGIVLPRLKRVELRGFDPLFDEPLVIVLPTGPFLILGGNTLGKTTILQATIYGLAGVADAVVEGDKGEKGFRWGIDYFKKRLDPETNAEIIVEFTLGDLSISVRRGMKNERVRGVRFGGGEWIHDSVVASTKFESAVKNAGNYTSFDDFRYLVHKLCYLAENRRSLLWNQRAQLRVLMLICGDAGKEASYHETRQALTRADSDRRHCKVDIGHIEARLARLEAATEGRQQRSSDRQPSNEGQVHRIGGIQKMLGEMTPRRIEMLTTVRSSRLSLESENSQLEELQTQLSRAEDTFVLHVLPLPLLHTNHRGTGADGEKTSRIG
jgi:DNA repair exonuclease SbcCD ATPase subunit